MATYQCTKKRKERQTGRRECVRGEGGERERERWRERKGERMREKEGEKESER